MNLYVVFGQRKESYPGEYGVEALAVMTEYDAEANESYLDEKVAEYRASNEFENVQKVCLNVSEKEIMKLLRPAAFAVPAQVNAE